MRLALASRLWQEVGGSERYALWLARRLARAGHELLLLHAEGGKADVPTAASLPLEDPASLARALADHRPEAILCLSSVPRPCWRELVRRAPVWRFVQDHTLFCPARNKLRARAEPCDEPLGPACLRTAAAGGCHGLEGAGALPRMLRRLAQTMAEIEDLRQARGVLVASRWMERELARAGLAGERLVRLAYPAMALEEEPEQPRASSPSQGGPAERTWDGFFDDLQPRSPRGGHPGRLGGDGGEAPVGRVLCAARLAHPDKGVDHLLTALARVRVPFQALIAGDGPARAWLERKTLEEGLGDRVRFAGWLDRQRLAHCYRAARVVAFPSVWDEPFGLVGLEAMAQARPVVAFAGGGVGDWLEHGTNGLLAPRRDSEAMARALERLLADPEQAERLGRAGRVLAEQRFAPGEHIARLLALLGTHRSSGAGARSGPGVARA